MALTQTGLKNAILSELAAASPIAQGPNTGDAAQWRDGFADAVAKAVIEYLVQNAEVESPTSLTVAHPLGPGQVLPFILPPGITLK